MKYQISKRFQKDLAKISDQKILTKVRKCIQAVGESRSLSEISNIEELNLITTTVSEFSGMAKLFKFSR